MARSAACLLSVCLLAMPIRGVLGRAAHSQSQRHSQAASNGLEGQQSPHCEHEAAISIAQQWAAARHSAGAAETYNGCPSSSWIRAYHDIVGNSQTKVIIDIGSNKGYFLMRLLHEFLPELRLTPARILTTLNQIKPQPEWGWCGDCSDCKAEPQHAEGALSQQQQIQQQQSLQDDLQTVQVYSFEPSGPNFNSLEYLKRAFFAVDDFQMSAPEASVHWSIFKMAVANFSGTAQFPANCLKEYCRLKLDGMADEDAELMSSLETVPVITIDEIVAGEILPQGLTTFDVLKMDAQGFDPLLLQGAEATLQAQRPAIVQYKYGYSGAWGQTTLHDTVHQMHQYGYMCYLDGSPTMMRLTGCWHPSFEYKMWGQVVCARAVDSALIQALDRLSFQATPAA